MKPLAILTPVLVLAIFFAAPLRAGDPVVTVNTLSDENGVCDGAGCSLREAIAVADLGATIEFSVTGTINLTDGQLTLSQDVNISGPGIASLAVDGGTRRVLRVLAGATVTLSDLTIQGGDLGTFSDPDGGGILNQGDLTLTRVAVTGNSSFSSPIDSSVDGGDGGGIYNATGATLAASQCRISGNSTGDSGFAFQSPGFHGGRGGGLFNLGTATLEDCSITGNTTGIGLNLVSDGGDGGGIYNAGILDLVRCTVGANITGDGGQSGASMGEDGRGAGLFSTGAGAEANVTNSTLSANRVGMTATGAEVPGGGIYLDGGVLWLRNITLSENIAGTIAGGLFVAGGTASVRHTLLAENTGGGQPDCGRSGGTLTSDGFNLVGADNGCSTFFVLNDQTGTAASPLDPLLGLLQDNGGDTETYALEFGSPAIDGGDPTGCTAFDPGTMMEAPLLDDQRGVSRPIDGDGDLQAVCDTGSFELVPMFFDLTVAPGGAGGGTVTSDPAGIDCGATCQASFVEGSVATLTPVADPGSIFDGWSGDCLGLETCAVTMDTDRMVGASFQPANTLTVSLFGSGSGAVTSAPTGIDCGADCNEVYLTGTPVSLTAAAAPGSVFIGWSGACTGADACDLTLDSDLAVDAEFAALFTLSITLSGTGTGMVTSEPTGIDCPGDCQQDYPDGTPVTLHPAAGLGSVFAQWTGACAGSGPCQTTMDAARSVDAEFFFSAIFADGFESGNTTAWSLSVP